ncbi:hypothetical protein [Pseudoduganella namucuonensis]|uniref:Lipoprotein n=1 Tax=Pseudoduganella namucuonensis TaxID=1035707 RepID=A0A1I7LVG0_9BURK|nr:hypothetical protein [Pseudoduganella namucuonensis]SFV13570.1 hypothetical protein SAMN05216552_103930 [Pseudoduganella namucuonensis]
MRRLLLATLPLLLTACVNDSATYYVDGTNQHTLSLRRQQDYFWNDNSRITLVATRLPECQRQIPLGEMLRDEVDIEVFSGGEFQWSLRSGDQVWQVQTQSCALVGESGPVAGAKVGTFKVNADNKLLFEEAPKAPGAGPAAAGAEPAPPVEPAPAPTAPPAN